MSGFNFGTGTLGSTNAGGGFPFGAATTGGFSLGNALGAAAATPATTASTTSSLGLGGSLFGQKAPGGFSFNTPAASTTASSGFSLAFNKPTGSAAPFSLTAATTSSTAAPTGAGLTFSSVLTSTVPQQPAATGFALGLGSTTTTAAGATVPSLGGGLFSSTVATLGQSTLGGGGGLTLSSLLSTSTAATAAPAPSIGLGGVDFSASSEKKSDTSSGANADSKALKDENLPPVICQDVENFKFVKEQKQVQEDISRMTSKAISKVQDDIKTLKQLLSVNASGLQRQALAIDKLKLETAQELKNADIALRTQKTPPGLQHENTAPSYFRCLVEQFEVQLQQYRQQIEELENHLTTQSSGSHITPQLTLAMQKLYQTFVAQAAQLQSVHENILKHQYLSYRRAFLEDSTDVFESKRASNRKWQSTPRVTTGPAPFSSVPNAAAVAMAATLTQQQQPTPNQAPLGGGFGNPFATAVGTSLGSTTLGFGGTNTSGFNFSNPGINPSAGLTFGVSNAPAAGFGTGAPLLQLKKPPAGNKRGKR
uniref:Nucleoporin 58 n=1 Tax=Hippocampus comes TaxID=109280 RepID=A0A3Q2YY56_HIPCM